MLRVPEDDACGTIETDGALQASRCYACRKSRLEAGSGLGTVWDVLRVARDKEGAKFVKTSDDYEGDEYYNYPPLIHGVTDDALQLQPAYAGVDLSQEEGDGVLRYGQEEMGNECARIHGSEWSCDGSAAVQEETVRCVGDAEAAMIRCCARRPPPAACFKKVCERAEKMPWQAVTLRREGAHQEIAGVLRRPHRD